MYENSNSTVPSHDCSVNWHGSSKAMEPDMAASMVHHLNDEGFKMDVIHADNDSTTAARSKSL